MVMLRDERSLSPTPPSPPDVACFSKRQKIRRPAVLPSRFWDNLSEKHLMRNALRELDRRNAKALYKPTRRHNRFARRESAKTERPESIDRFLGKCSPTRLDRSGIGRRKRASHSPLKKSNTATTKSTGPYDRDFQQHLIDHNILPHRETLRQRRPSPSLLSDDKFDAFQQAEEHATKESQITVDVIPTIEGDIEDRKCIGRQVPFTNLDYLTNKVQVHRKCASIRGRRGCSFRRMGCRFWRPFCEAPAASLAPPHRHGSEMPHNAGRQQADRQPTMPLVG
ncbi:Uncharacterized protein TCAP_07477 [Tolypocladium capitatum]|uniref:Uncharacterized protein n=1 Tax=Tolypocladium capitatum TaxID=45235 RepID=A0A2K3PWQ1_9HYPO|nr:Uncharacterized protein TCAP_07477 [Tolypocladium capitatum]